MDWGRNPACNIESLAGCHIASGTDSVTERDDKEARADSQALIGNRCGHDKHRYKKPLFSNSTARRPHVIEESKRRVQQAFSDIYAYPKFTQVFYHPVNLEGGGRRRRSEAIEGTLSLTLTALLHTLNLQKMACGFYDSGNKFHYYNYAWIEKATDQHAARVKREMKVLQDYGIIKVVTNRQRNSDGSWRTIDVRIEMTDKIFMMLDLEDAFTRDRETISIKFHTKQARLDKNRARRDIYRKPSFSQPKARASSKDASIALLTAQLTRRPSNPIKSGRGQEIKDLYLRLTSQGVSPAEAAEIIRNKYPPPS